MKPKQALVRAAEIFDLPGDIVTGVARVEVTGGTEVFIENHGGILEYADTLCRINGGEVVIEVRGAGLNIFAMNASEMRIRGRVFAVDFKY